MKGRLIFQLIGFFLGSTLEVQIHASEIKDISNKEPVLVPENCLLESSVCSIKTKSGFTYRLDGENYIVVLDTQTSFSRLSANSGSLMSGVIYVNSSNTYIVDTPYGKINLNNSDAIIELVEHKVLVKSVRGKVDLFPRGHENSIDLRAGYENWFSKVDTKGKSITGILKPFDPEKLMKILARLYPGSKEDLISLVTELKLKWKDAVLETSMIHKNMVERELANQKETKLRQEQAKKQWETERAFWRKMYFQRSFE